MDTFDDLWERAEADRRDLLAAGSATGFVAGFALSAQPVMAQTMVVTDTTGLEAGMPEAPHAFFAGYRPSYREMAAKDGWRRLQDWFKTHDVA